MNKMTFEQVDAMTNTELLEAIVDLNSDADVKAIRRMRHEQKVTMYWNLLEAVGMQDVPAPEPTPEVAVTAPKVKKGKEPKECACGCGQMTRGGTWMPGHDAKHHSAQLAAEGKLKHAPKECLCGCGLMTAGGTFKPGHDARFYSRLHKSAGIGLDVAKPHVGKDAFMPETINPEEVALIAHVA